MKQGNRTLRLFAMLALLVALCISCTAAMAEEKTLTVGENETYQTIQAAIDYIAGQADSTGWTINVKAGEYDRFTVPHWSESGIANLTIAGENESDVVIRVLDKAYTESDLIDNGGINIYGKNVRLENMTIKAGTVKQAWDDSAISTNHGKIGGEDVSLTVQNCTLIGPGIGKGATYGIFWACSGMNVMDCTISGFANAIEFMNDRYYIPAGKTYSFTNNTITGSSFAIHGYMGVKNGGENGGGNGGGTFLIANNTITGTDDLRSKIITQDNKEKSFVVDMKNNTLENALIGTVNLHDNGDIVSDILAYNTFGKNCFYVDAIEPGTIEFYTNYYAPPNDQYGEWQLTGKDDFDVEWGKNPDGSTAHIQQLIEKANKENSRKLSITGIDEHNLIKTFTWFKDGIYWQTLPAPTPTPTLVPTPVPPSAPPKTGDDMPLIGAAACIFLSAAIFLALSCRRRHV